MLSLSSGYVYALRPLVVSLNKAHIQHVTVAILAEGRPSMSVLAPAGLACLLFIYEAVRTYHPYSVRVFSPVTPAICRPHRSDPSSRRRASATTRSTCTCSAAPPASANRKTRSRNRHSRGTGSTRWYASSSSPSTTTRSTAATVVLPLPVAAHPNGSRSTPLYVVLPFLVSILR